MKRIILMLALVLTLSFAFSAPAAFAGVTTTQDATFNAVDFDGDIACDKQKKKGCPEKCKDCPCKDKGDCDCENCPKKDDCPCKKGGCDKKE